MAGERRKFRREGEERRRDALIAAALDLIAEAGPQAATVRAIAARAGVTSGLIRHYFQRKEDLTRAAYETVMARMTADNFAVLDAAPIGPEARLAAFVAASLRPPVVDGRAMGLWAGFIAEVRRDPAMRMVHERNYLQYRTLLEGLIAELVGRSDRTRLRALAIACNGLIDGLWLEGCALPDGFAADELVTVGAGAIGAILGVDLISHLPGPQTPAPAAPPLLHLEMNPT